MSQCEKRQRSIVEKACEGLFERWKNKEDRRLTDADGWVGFR